MGFFVVCPGFSRTCRRSPGRSIVIAVPSSATKAYSACAREPQMGYRARNASRSSQMAGRRKSRGSWLGKYVAAQRGQISRRGRYCGVAAEDDDDGGRTGHRLRQIGVRGQAPGRLFQIPKNRKISNIVAAVSLWHESMRESPDRLHRVGLGPEIWVGYVGPSETNLDTPRFFPDGPVIQD